MIQRIQSLFLLAATVLSVIIMIHPVSSMMMAGQLEAEFFVYGLMSIGDAPEMLFNTFPVVIFAAVTLLLTIVTILLYRNRTLQMRICVFNILLTLGLILSIFIYYYIFKRKFDISTHAFSYSVVFPFVNVILIFQAFRGIRRDDLLLKSYNRLRD